VTPGAERLLAMAEAVQPPFVLLEDGRDAGTSVLAWGAGERLTLPWSAARVDLLDTLRPGDGWIGCLAYDLGLPPGAARRNATLDQPLLDVFRPRHRVVLRPGFAPTFSSGEAAARWRDADTAPRAYAGGRARSLGRSFDRPGFEAAVRAALEYIRAGDIYQVNLSVAERLTVSEAPLAVYRRLRRLNPSPWMGFADLGDWQLICGSPELLVEVDGGRARARPIAGTRKKTGDGATDAAMRAELVSDRKEAAEHVMLVDLARNDLGRIAAWGGVRVAALGRVEEYSHVMHLVSDVEAVPRADVSTFDVFRAMFPGGTITGCPKIRAMEIIAELEPVARGMYTGALGWWEAGAAQWNIVIRSAVVRNGEAVIQSGAGIVADSDPAREWKESLRKAAALREAFGVEERER